MQDFISSFANIDQKAMWFLPFLDIHQALHAQIVNHPPKNLAGWLNAYFTRQTLNTSIHNTDKKLTFTSQDDLPNGTSYEQFIFHQHKIPTRNNLHDWFGACIWSYFPKTKALLNHKHCQNFTQNNQRNRLRDTITVFDENGAILVVSDEMIGEAIADSLAKFDWQHCLVDNRFYWHNPINPKANDKAQIMIFGHALLEQLITPRKALCSHTVIINVPSTFFGLSLKDKYAFIDECLCWQMDKFLQDGVTPQMLNPLPILGVPYFWKENQNPDFYQDSFVFRKGRKNS